jgi:hypothetical protein
LSRNLIDPIEMNVFWCFYTSKVHRFKGAKKKWTQFHSLLTAKQTEQHLETLWRLIILDRLMKTMDYLMNKVYQTLQGRMNTSGCSRGGLIQCSEGEEIYHFDVKSMYPSLILQYKHRPFRLKEHEQTVLQVQSERFKLHDHCRHWRFGSVSLELFFLIDWIDSFSFTFSIFFMPIIFIYDILIALGKRGLGMVCF